MYDDGSVDTGEADKPPEKEHGHDLNFLFERPLELPQWMYGERQDDEIGQNVARPEDCTCNIQVHTPMMCHRVPVGSEWKTLYGRTESLNKTIAEHENTYCPKRLGEFRTDGEYTMIEV